MKFQEVKGELMVAGCLFFGIGALGAFAGNAVGQHANSRTAFDVADASNVMRSKTFLFLETVDGDDCRQNVLSTMLADTGIYQPSPEPEEIADTWKSVCDQTVDETVATASADAFDQVQESRREYQEMLNNSDYTDQEKLAYAAAGFFGGILVTGGLIGGFTNLSELFFD